MNMYQRLELVSAKNYIVKLEGRLKEYKRLAKGVQFGYVTGDTLTEDIDGENWFDARDRLAKEHEESDNE